MTGESKSSNAILLSQCFVELRAVLLTLAALGGATTAARARSVAGAVARRSSRALVSTLCSSSGLADFLVCRADVQRV